MNQYCKYIVLTHGRTGATIVTRMLRGHSCAVDYQELFNTNFQAEFGRGADRAKSLRYWLDTFDHDKAPQRPPLTSLGSADVKTLLDTHVWHDGYAPRVRGASCSTGFIERTFSWFEKRERRQGLIPYREPWIGVIHNPPGVTRWHGFQDSPQAILAGESLQRALAGV